MYNNDYDYEDEDDHDDNVAVAPKPLTEAEQKALEEQRAKNRTEAIKDDTYAVKDKLKAIGCKWNSFGKYWYAIGDVMIAKANQIVADHLAAVVAARGPATEPLIGTLSGQTGHSVTINDVTVEKCFEIETEFNRKKVISTIAIFTDREGRKFKWKSSAMPCEVEAGATFSKLTGKVKQFDQRDGETVTVLKNCKIEGCVKLSSTHSLTLFCDAKAASDQFAYCAADGSVLEYGLIPRGATHDFYPGYNGEQSNSEICASLLAFNFARRVKEAAKLESLTLEFNFDAQWMKGMVGKAKPLRDFAKKHKLLVKMNWISGTDNPADEWTTASGNKSVPDAELAALAKSNQ